MIKRLDYFLLFIVAILLILGISFLSALSAPISLSKFGTTNHYLIHQIVYGFLPGIFLCLIAFLIPLSFFKRISFLAFLLNLLVLISVFIPGIGSRFWGANRWLSLGSIGLQPSEFLKITSILYLSTWLSNRINQQPQGPKALKDKIPRNSFKQILLPFLIFLTVISVIFILQPNVSTLGIIGLTALVIYFASGTPLWHTLLITIFGSSGLILLLKYGSYRASRLLVFLNPNIDPLGIGYQINQALIAIGSGGIGGRGLGMSSQKFGFLPQTMSDSTFAVYAEESGFVGCIFLILLFSLFLWAGLAVARRSDDRFSKLVALGITFWILFQGFANISSMIGIFPLTGIPLPFISYGGSHIIAELIGVGILLNIARHQKSNT
jgi:cell division protein FtsW